MGTRAMGEAGSATAGSMTGFDATRMTFAPLTRPELGFQPQDRNSGPWHAGLAGFGHRDEVSRDALSTGNNGARVAVTTVVQPARTSKLQ